MRYRYYTCDVFTEERFGGNPLAVLPDAEGLSEAQMQRIAREFNYSETTFVLPADQPNRWKVRIFTPTREVPFAGHPNVGTAFVLASTGQVDANATGAHITFDEQAGPVPMSIETRERGRLWCELAAPQPLSLREAVPVEALARAAALGPDDVVTSGHPPCVASVGLPFVIAELRDAAALARARPVTAACEALATAGHPPDVYVYVRAEREADPAAIRARMFAPVDGVPEDPATGSAGCALAGLLGHLEASESGAFAWRIAQGVEMGRPSRLDARVEKRDAAVTDVWIGGSSVMVAEGWIEVG